MTKLSRGQRAVVGGVAGIGAGLVIVPAAQAADVQVTSTADSGAGTLRQAIVTSNLNPSSDRILFQSSLSGRITLASNLPSIYGPLSVEGPGSDQLAVDGNDQFSIFRATEDLSVSGLSLEKGFNVGSGSAVLSLTAALEVDGVEFTGNSANMEGGAIIVIGGSAEIRNSVFTGNSSNFLGGALSTEAASSTISNSTFAGNLSPYGGAVAIQGNPSETSISGSSFTGNGAGAAGGALLDDSSGPIEIKTSLIADNSAVLSGGGGLFLSGGGDNLISNSTITGNTATGRGGGISSNADNMAIESSTLTGNTTNSPVTPQADGAGLHLADATATLTNSIISANSPADLSTAAGGAMSGSFDLIGDRSNALFAEPVPGSNVTSTTPQLDALAENGGPTRTMLPADGSPAVNKGSSALTVDQRGLTRPVNFPGVPFSTAAGADGADIGAVEVQLAPNNFTFGKVKLNRKKGIATLQVKVPGKGKVVLAGSKTVRGLKKTAKKKATIGLTVKAKGKAAKALKKKGKAKVKARVTFTPNGGKAKTKSKTVKLVRKKR